MIILDLFKIINTVSGNISHKPDKPDNYYRLKWLDDKAYLSYSKIIKTKTSIADAITNVRLSATGELKFTVTSTTSQSYRFKVTAIDGKLLGEIPLHAFTPGRHIVALKHLPIKGTTLLVTSYSANGQKTWFLSIQ
jgi:hypothetical protein